MLCAGWDYEAVPGLKLAGGLAVNQQFSLALDNVGDLLPGMGVAAGRGAGSNLNVRNGFAAFSPLSGRNRVEWKHETLLRMRIGIGSHSLCPIKRNRGRSGGEVFAGTDPPEFRESAGE